VRDPKMKTVVSRQLKLFVPFSEKSLEERLTSLAHFIKSCSNAGAVRIHNS
jgi:hypothetical protein